ncbi:hypothetical protein [Leptospira sp. GIMC2001]|uniref:hypothetical protein n=1 Tax=Leptospira sp. GIMC2001 TaxID=1513297 RepID=UPI00234A8BC5|nr:hypothetical protein [Leptospira sp. GIMC2001]WCL50109.1 hypothetical protein O4O04_04630 [Leptospira sp. GIMC2001]
MKEKFYIWIGIYCFFLFNNSTFSQYKAVENSESRSGILNQRSNADHYITLYPGIQYRSSNLIVTSPGGQEIRHPDGESNETKFFLDIKTRDFQWGPVWGGYVLYQNHSFAMTQQTIDEPFGGAFTRQSYNGFPSAKSIGTKVEGEVSSLLAVFYLGEKGADNFRFGIGIGPSNVNIRTNSDFYDGWGTQSPIFGFRNSQGIENQLTDIGRIAAFRNGKLESDPLSLYLLSNLSAQGNLDLLGLYQLSQDKFDIASLNPYTVFLIQEYAQGSLTPFQILTLANLGKSTKNIEDRYVGTFYFFFEYPIFDLTFRFGYGGPIYDRNDYQVTFRNVDLSIFFPIDI